MLQKCTYENGVVGITSTLLKAAGVPHAFSTRIGGVSGGAFASLNLGNPANTPVRDSEANLHENYDRFVQALELEGKSVCRVHQVHGSEILEIGSRGTSPVGCEADGLLTGNSELILSIRTADCVPILLASRNGKQVAALHAGWRGVVAGILPQCVRLLIAKGVEAREIVLAIGPCISGENFEIGEEVAEQFLKAGLGEAITRSGGQRPHADMVAALAQQAFNAGIPERNCDQGDFCTVRDRELFFSHRRDQGLTGRMAAVIAARAEESR